MAAVAQKSVNFEVFGKVQGVFFRKHTESQAKKLGLCGWVKNTDTGTVVGVIEGPEDKVAIIHLLYLCLSARHIQRALSYTLVSARTGNMMFSKSALEEEVAPGDRKSKIKDLEMCLQR